LKNNDDSYSATQYRYVGNLQACVKTTVSGRIRYTSERLANQTGPGYFYRIRKVTLVAPKTTATVYRYDPGSHSCTTRKFRVARLAVSQAISGYSCTFSPQVSVSVPFRVSMGFWPSCKNRNAARYRGSVSRNSTIIQANQDSRVRFGDQVNTSPKPKCYATAVNFRIIAGSTVATARTGRMKICMTPTY
jgi:hypothetical protein